MAEEHIVSREGDYKKDSFQRRQIAVTFNVAMSGGLTNTLTLSDNYRIKATINSAGQGLGTTLDLKIEGMAQNEMNLLSYMPNLPNLWNPTASNQSQSTVIVRAGIYGQPLTMVFYGLITESFADYSGGSATFNVKAKTSVLLARIIPPAFSYSGPRSVTSILSDLCTASGLVLVDHGGWGGTQLSNHLSAGTTFDQIKHAIKSVRGVWDFRPMIDNKATDTGGKGTEKNKKKDAETTEKTTKEKPKMTGALHVWGPRYGGDVSDVNLNQVPHISAQTGMLGYPKYSSDGIILQCLLRPDIALWEPIMVNSDYIPAGRSTCPLTGANKQGQKLWSTNAPWNGYWIPSSIKHDLSSEISDGLWQTEITCRMTITGQTKSPKA